jgi:L-erythro-3,5-diaminohexanoate dehydrogenase
VSVSFGSASGDHRVLEPAGATPVEARRLDALGELWDGEVRIDLEALVLDADDLRAWRARLGGDPTVLAAAIVETVAERGGLDGEPGRGTYVGAVAAVGRAHPWPAGVGERVALPVPAVAVPAFAVPGPWDGRTPVVPLRGHAIAPAGVPTVLVPAGASATAARVLARHADVPAAADALVDTWPRSSTTGPASGAPRTDPSRMAAVLGAASPPGAIVLAHLASRGVPTVAVVGSLEAARVAEALGADAVVVADLADAAGSAAVVAETLGSPAAEDVLVGAAIVADATAVALAVRVARRVLVVDGGAGASRVAAAASDAARPVDVLVHRDPGVGRGSRVVDLVASVPALAAALRWHTGAPFPPATGHELPPWERT